MLQQQFLAEQTTLNKLLNREKEVSIVVVDKLNMPSEDFEITY